MSEKPEQCPFCGGQRDQNPNGHIRICGSYQHGREPHQSDLCSEREDRQQLETELAEVRKEVSFPNDALNAINERNAHSENAKTNKIVQLKTELADLQQQLDASCNAEELRQVRAELKQDRARLRFLYLMGARVVWFMSGGSKRWQVSVDGQLGPASATPNEAVDAAMSEASPCPTCHDIGMVPSDEPGGDVMNTPCPTCNPWSKPGYRESGVSPSPPATG